MSMNNQNGFATQPSPGAVAPPSPAAASEGEDGAQGTARPTSGGASGTGERRTLRLGPVAVKAREKMTSRELTEAQRDHQAGINLECEIRRMARESGLDPAVAAKLGTATWGAFRIVEGEPVPVGADRQTVLLAADGVNVMGVQEWFGKQLRSLGLGPRDTKGQWQGLDDDEVLPMRNPFRRKTWNLTEQMRLGRRDPKLARKLKAEAWADGENLKR